MRYVSILALASTLLSIAPGCSVRYRARASRTTVRAGVAVSVPQRVVVTARPPAVRPAVSARPSRPDPSAIWVAGHYEWSAGGWVWVDGRWESGHSEQVWVDPVVRVEQGQTVYYPGYWCPADQAPADPYRDPGAVVVAAPGGTTDAPAPGRPIRVRTPEHEPSDESGRPIRVRTPEQEPSDGSGRPIRVRTPEQEPSDGSGRPIRVRTPEQEPSDESGRPIRVRTPEEARPEASSRPDRARPPRTERPTRRAPTRPTATTGGPGSVRVRGERGRPAASGGRVRVRGGTVYTPDTRPATAAPPARTDRPASGSAAPSARTDRAASGSAAPSARTDRAASSPRPPASVGTVATVRDATPERRTPPERGATPRTIPLSCSVTTPRAPRGGAVTIQGAGFRSPTVRIAGLIVRIVRRSATRLVVAAPSQPGNGDVSVTDSGRRATCGRIEVR